MWRSQPLVSIKPNSFQQTAHNRFNINHLRTTNFHKLQYHLHSGSGPGGRRFKSSLPDHLFSATYKPSEVLKNPAVGKNATLFSFRLYFSLFPLNCSTRVSHAITK